MSQFYEKPTAYTEAGGFSPAPRPKERGCFFYGCLFAVIALVITAVGIGVAGYTGYRYLTKLVAENTEATPMDLPKVEIPEEELKTLTDRWESFRKAVKDDEPIEELELSAQDINALIAQDENLSGKVHVEIAGDKIQAKLSIPVDFLGPPGKGRFFNAEGELKASLENENLVVKLVSAKIKGKDLDDKFMTSIQGQNLAKDVGNNKENREFIAKFESIKVKDGKVIIVPKKLTEVAKGTDAVEKTEVSKPDETKTEVEQPKVEADKPTEPKSEVEQPKVEAEKPADPKVGETPKAAA